MFVAAHIFRRSSAELSPSKTRIALLIERPKYNIVFVFGWQNCFCTCHICHLCQRIYGLDITGERHEKLRNDFDIFRTIIIGWLVFNGLNDEREQKWNVLKCCVCVVVDVVSSQAKVQLFFVLLLLFTLGSHWVFKCVAKPLASDKGERIAS